MLRLTLCFLLELSAIHHSLGIIPELVKIGIMTPTFTEDWSIFTSYQQYLGCMLMAVEEINQNDYLLPLTTIKVAYRNSKRDSSTVIPLSFRFSKNVFNDTGVDGIIGPVTSSESETSAAVLSEFGIPQISMSATSPSLSSKMSYPYFTRTCPSDAFQGKAMAALVKHFRWKKVITFSTSNTYGSAGISTFIEASTELGINVVHSFSFSPGTKDFTKIINTARQSKVNIFIIFTDTTSAAKLLQQGYDMHLFDANSQIIGSDSVTSSSTLSAINPSSLVEIMKGYIGVAFFSDMSTKRGSEFVDRLRHTPATNAGPHSACSDERDDTGEYYYREVDPATNKEYCSGYNFTALSPTGDNLSPSVPYAYDAIYAMAHAMHIELYEKGAERLRGESVYETLVNNVSFEGVTGSVSFYQGAESTIFGEGDRHNDIRYGYYNFQPQIGSADELITNSLVPVGTWTYESGLDLCDDMLARNCPITFRTENNEPPEDYSPSEHLHMSFASEATLLFLAIMEFLLTAIFLVGAVVFRRSKVVKKSNVYILIAILFGYLLGAVYIVLHTRTPTDSICQAQLGLFYSSLWIILSALVIKTWRVYQDSEVSDFLDKSLIPIYIVICIPFITLIVAIVFAGVREVDLEKFVNDRFTIEKKCEMVYLQYETTLFVLSIMYVFVLSALCWHLHRGVGGKDTRNTLLATLCIGAIFIAEFTMSSSFHLAEGLSYIVGLLLSMGCIFVPKAASLIELAHEAHKAHNAHRSAQRGRYFFVDVSEMNSTPLHQILLQQSDEYHDDQLLEMLREEPFLGMQRDCHQRTAIDLIIEGYNQCPVGSETVFALLLSSLPYDEKTCELTDNIEPESPWFAALKSNDEVIVDAVIQVIHHLRRSIKELAVATDSAGRCGKDIAIPRCKDVLLRKLYLFERYDIKEGEPEHWTTTSRVHFAIDHGDDSSGKGIRVALKFISSLEDFRREIDIRKDSGFDDTFVLKILSAYDGLGSSKQDLSFREDAIMKGFVNYPFCIVMEAATADLRVELHRHRVIDSNMDGVKLLMRQLCWCLQHIHEKGIVHGDFTPANILRFENSIKLCDFDASGNCFHMEYVSRKHSSGYIPPELLGEDADKNIFVRTHSGNEESGTANSDYDPVFAHPAQDMWAFGCMLYLHCTGCSLFHVTVNDEIIMSDEFLELYEWKDDIKQKKLKVVKDVMARNLLSLLLTKDPSKRLTVNRVLSHPFLSGKHSPRLQGEEATWDIFLSYRVASDAHHAELIYKALTKKGLNVWWDRACLAPGHNWEEGFCEGLLTSANFVCLVSRGAMHKFGTATADMACDNFLLEWRIALELKDRRMLHGIFPVMIGDKDADEVYSHYFRSECHPSNLPDICVSSVESKFREHLDKSGLGMPYKDSASVKQIVDTVLKNQGEFLVDKLSSSIPRIVTSIIDMLDEHDEDETRSQTSAKRFLQRTANSLLPFNSTIKMKGMRLLSTTKIRKSSRKKARRRNSKIMCSVKAERGSVSVSETSTPALSEEDGRSEIQSRHPAIQEYEDFRRSENTKLAGSQDGNDILYKSENESFALDEENDIECKAHHH